MSVNWKDKFDSCEQRRKTGWARYYEECRNNIISSTNTYNSIAPIFENEDVIEELPIIVVNQLKEAMVELKKKFECSICLQNITVDDLKITRCGHRFHKDCINHITIKNCPLCKTKIK